MIHYSRPPVNPDTSKTIRTMLRSDQNNKETIPTEKERLFITNTIKGHKVTDLTRPNELSTTTIKAATKGTSRTRLWK
jgi:hypothetical protein